MERDLLVRRHFTLTGRDLGAHCARGAPFKPRRRRRRVSEHRASKLMPMLRNVSEKPHSMMGSEWFILRRDRKRETAPLPTKQEVKRKPFEAPDLLIIELQVSEFALLGAKVMMVLPELCERIATWSST